MALAVAVEVIPLHYSAVVEAPVNAVGSVGVLPSFQLSTTPSTGSTYTIKLRVACLHYQVRILTN